MLPVRFYSKQPTERKGGREGRRTDGTKEGREVVGEQRWIKHAEVND